MFKSSKHREGSLELLPPINGINTIKPPDMIDKYSAVEIDGCIEYDEDKKSVTIKNEKFAHPYLVIPDKLIVINDELYYTIDDKAYKLKLDEGTPQYMGTTQYNIVFQYDNKLYGFREDKYIELNGVENPKTYPLTSDNQTASINSGNIVIHYPYRRDAIYALGRIYGGDYEYLKGCEYYDLTTKTIGYWGTPQDYLYHLYGSDDLLVSVTYNTNATPTLYVTRADGATASYPSGLPTGNANSNRVKKKGFRGDYFYFSINNDKDFYRCNISVLDTLTGSFGTHLCEKIPAFSGIMINDFNGARLEENGKVYDENDNLISDCSALYNSLVEQYNDYGTEGMDTVKKVVVAEYFNGKSIIYAIQSYTSPNIDYYISDGNTTLYKGTVAIVDNVMTYVDFIVTRRLGNQMDLYIRLYNHFGHFTEAKGYPCENPIVRGGRLITYNGDTLYYSGVGTLDFTVGTTDDSGKFLEVGYKESGEIAKTVNGIDLIVFKDNNKIYRVQGEYPDWVIREIAESSPPISEVISYGNTLIYSSREGVKQLNTSNVYGDYIVSDFNSTVDLMGCRSICVSKKRKSILFAVKDKIMEYNINYNTWTTILRGVTARNIVECNDDIVFIDDTITGLLTKLSDKNTYSFTYGRQLNGDKFLIKAMTLYAKSNTLLDAEENNTHCGDIVIDIGNGKTYNFKINLNDYRIKKHQIATTNNLQPKVTVTGDIAIDKIIIDYAIIGDE